jgi:predicted nuclease with TOPRIM domain
LRNPIFLVSREFPGDTKSRLHLRTCVYTFRGSFSALVIYECAKCKNKVSIEDLEVVFQEQLRNLVVEPQAVTEYLSDADAKIGQAEALLASQEAEAARLSEKLDGLLGLFMAKKLTKDDFGERYQPLEVRREQIRQELPRLRGEVDGLRFSRASTGQVLQEAGDLHSHWPSLEPHEKRRIVEQLAERITIGTSEIEIDLAFRPTPPDLGNRDTKATNPHGFMAARS